MVNYAWVGLSQGKPWWKFVAILTCKSFVKPGHRGERLIEPFSSWFPPKFPSGLLKLMNKQLHLVKRMIRSLREVNSLTYSQTLNGCDLDLRFVSERIGTQMICHLFFFQWMDEPLVGHVSGKQDWRCGMNQTSSYGAKVYTHFIYHKGCWFI